MILDTIQDDARAVILDRYQDPPGLRSPAIVSILNDMNTIDFVWILWATVVSVLVIRWARARRKRPAWIGTGEIGGIPATIRATFTDSDTPPEIEGITWRRP